MGKRIYPLKLIKYWFCYDIDDICHLYQQYSLNHQTVRKWIRKGLKTIDKGKPILIYGYELKAFLGKQNQSNKCQTEFNQMFCMKCQEGKEFYKKQIQLEANQQFLRAKALCSNCKSVMNKPYKLADLPELRKMFAVVDVLQLYDCENPPVKTHLDDQDKRGISEPIQGELF